MTVKIIWFSPFISHRKRKPEKQNGNQRPRCKSQPESDFHVVVVEPLSCVWLFYNPMDCSPPISSVRGISQARILEWVVMTSSKGSSPPRDQTWISCISCIGRGIFTSEPPGKLLTFRSPVLSKTIIITGNDSYRGSQSFWTPMTSHIWPATWEVPQSLHVVRTEVAEEGVGSRTRQQGFPNLRQEH